MSTTTYILSLFAAAVLVVFFRPLLTGMAKALWLLFVPKLSREERMARAKLRDARLMARLIRSSASADEASELRALASRA